ncbi:ABC transporter thiamine pyrophosphate-binding lipoprotein p37/Cypl [Mycoplasmopsis lipofaciens]|uniref:ABC transporter thiamine pyrophosphate-binding lipoprotein p37/Cypl n=1 Tax=Mycoplasmopsis lipofaciens TaxID=114884 RepID=UPI0004870539|nr:PhnD/SsuA/transferrin family substrate-binding protein [Mycoplasmopsis lipofaciens]
MKKLNKILTLSTVTMSVAPLSLLASCNKEENKFDYIKIGYVWHNPAFENEKQQFINQLNEKVAELQAKDAELSKMKPIKIQLQDGIDKSTMIDDLKSNKKDIDVAILPYSSFAKPLYEEQNLNDFNLPLIAQTSTLRFTWGLEDNEHYIDGTVNDPLYKAAIKENQLQFDKFGEFPEWQQTNSALQWDGSKYKVFYKENETTYVYHGMVLISGDETQRNQIRNAWLTKDWDAFKNFGIVYKKSSSGGAYKYQAALFARHFKKTLDQINNDLILNKGDKVLSGKSAGSALGVADDKGNIFNISFDDEGAFNWTNWESYKPSKPTDKIRVLTMTNPAPYDAVFGRSNLSEKKQELIKKVLTSLSIEDNKLGIYTGYNKFNNLDKDLFKKLIKLQQAAEDPTIDLNTIVIPSIQ